MKVFVVMSGYYDSYGLSGVYATLPAAIASNPIDMTQKKWRDGGWMQETDGSWRNGIDLTEIHECEVLT